LVDRDEGIVLVIEVKGRRTRINGWVGYCRMAPAGESSQLVCYPHSCWTDHDLSKAKFLLVAPEARIPHLQKERQRVADNYAGTIGSDPWLTANLELLFRELIGIATRSGRPQAHASVLTRLLAHWWWQWIPPEVPLVIT
jgi:hypothetical protein